MKCSLLSALVALSLVPCAYGQTKTSSATITLSNIGARSIPFLLRHVKGIDELTCDFNKNSVTIRGSQEAVAAAEAEIRAADVRVPFYRITMRLVRYHVDGQGRCIEQTVSTPNMFDTDNSLAACSFVTQGQEGYTLMVTPHHETDQAVTLTVEVQELGEQGEVVRSGKNVRLVPLGKTVHITGMTDATDKPLRRAVQQGEIVTDRGAYSGYYVEVTPTIVPNS